MGVWFNSLISVFIVSAISLIGILTLLIKKENLAKVLSFFVSFSAGALFGGVFLHLLPEAVEEYGFTLQISLYLILGILIFFILEKFVHWRHCHIPTSKQHPHPMAFTNIIGDGLHNLIDGMIIGGSYLASPSLGVTTTIAVIIHEIPQEMGDFGVLLHAGLSKIKALFFNFLSALMAVIGVIISLSLGSNLENYMMVLLPLTAGGFIYIAGSDLIPELHKECTASKSFMQFLFLVLGILVMAGLKIVNLG
ncbi:ZIP family metal transporter [Candidatus Woesearchaeota archaeon]|nr:ZIP family metal transporter [Candidatus Woesearchaeota archaeon]